MDFSKAWNGYFDSTSEFLGFAAVGLTIFAVFCFGLLYKCLLAPTVPPFNHLRPVNLMPFSTKAQNLTDGETPLSHRAFELIGNLLV